jgi:hypothetical protein
MVIFSLGGDGSGGTKPADGAPAGGDEGMKDAGMAPGTLFRERTRENARAELKLKETGTGGGAVFNKCLEVKTLVMKMEETGKPFKLVNKNGTSFIAGAKDFPDSETKLDEFFEVATKAHKRGGSAFVGMWMESCTRMAKIKGVQQMFLWLQQRRIFLRPAKLESVQTSRIGFWKGLSPMGHSSSESEQKIKHASVQLMDSTEMETGDKQGKGGVPTLELVPATVTQDWTAGRPGAP